VHPYGLREVEKLLGLPRSMIRTLVRAGFVSPEKGPRNAWRFSFQDLIVLRTAQALAAANVPTRRIARSMRELRRRLPASMPLSGLSVAAEADRVVVKEGAQRWQVDSGQYLLSFAASAIDGSLSVIESQAAHAAQLLEQALELEESDAAAARAMYERVVALDPTLVDAQINLGGLLHRAGELQSAEAVYRNAIRSCGNEPMLLYNLGVLLEDLDRRQDALDVYELALRTDPAFADCHYNAGLLCEALAKPRDAIRHMAQYRRLTLVK